MFKLLVDTWVWLDIAKDPKQVPVLDVVRAMISRGIVSLIVPQIVLDEFQRNWERIAKENAKSLSTHFRLVRDAVSRLEDDKEMVDAVNDYLEDVDHKIPLRAANEILDEIERLLTLFAPIEPSEAAKLRAAQRALEKKAPFHHGRNSMADAIIIETYADCIRAKAPGIRFAFVTHNKADFSVENGNHRIPHPDFAHLFTRIKSLYFINILEALRRIEPSLTSDLLYDYLGFEEPRGRLEILETMDLLFHQVWYTRHQILRAGVEDGKYKVVDSNTYDKIGPAPGIMRKDVWEGALKAARKVEREYGKQNLGPFDDFEWGMINGKLSALRWVLGEEWDMLDT